MSIFEDLNPEQLRAVQTTEGPLLILAGAGSGKTRVITHRIAYLIEECGVNPWNILAITFTNKAAAEMRERVDALVGFGSENIWVSTFHSMCVRILRRYIDSIGYDRNFTIYDGDDQKTLMRDVCKYLDIDTKKFKERTFLNVISSCKDRCISPEVYAATAVGDSNKARYAKVYTEYQRRLKLANALDFDDLICKTIELFKKDSEALEYYRRRFTYIMVDEYQDTNNAQFQLIKQLASFTDDEGHVHHNLCVVGDDDQSIYKFRGADIYNILSFEAQYPSTTVIKLEQNYRSTGNILDAANEVIRNNTGRKAKALWTEAGKGTPICFTRHMNEYEEADGIAAKIKELSQTSGYKYSDFAVLYRTNAQSRVLEEKLIQRSIPYKVIGSVNFYQRKEVKDVLAYLKVLENRSDDIALKRIINVPKRGIGLTTVDRVTAYAAEHDICFFDALRDAAMIPGLERSSSKLTTFVNFLMSKSRDIHEDSNLISDVVRSLLDETGFLDDLREDGNDEAMARVDNVEELINKIVTYEESSIEEPPTLGGFLQDVSLVADIDNLKDTDDDSRNFVVLMTLHSAKGLEFPVVFISGMEDGLFPSYLSISSGDTDEVEEERRLCYVGITRAKQQLFLSCAMTRMSHGETQYNKPSRFIREIPRYLITEQAYEGDTPSSVMKSSLQSSRTPQTSLFGGSGIHTQPRDTQRRSAGASLPLGSNPYIQKGLSLSSPVSVEYDIGDKVSHIKFGTGVVTAIVDKGRDKEVTVDFEGNVGTRKMLASFAKLKKL